MRSSFYAYLLQHSEDERVVPGSMRAHSLTSFRPSISAAIFKQKHKVVASALVNVTPSFNIPLINPYIFLSASPAITNAVPILGAPALIQKVVPRATDLTAAIPVLGPAVLKQKQVLLKTNITAAIPVIGASNLSQTIKQVWTPAALLIQPRAILDGETANWIGTSLGDTVNAGTLGGTFVATTPGIVAKSPTRLNGYDVFNFAGDCALGIPGLNWNAENVSIFAVASPLHDGVTHGMASMGFYDALQGWVFYSSLAAGGSIEGNTINANDMLIFGSGGDATKNRIVVPPPPTGFALMFMEAGTINSIRGNGSVLTPSYSVTGPNSAMINQRLNIGAGNALTSVFETFNGQIAYLLVLTDVAPLEIEKLEGWAAWKYGLQALLPVGHTYKLGPPLSSAVGVTVGLIAANLNNVPFLYTLSPLNGKINLSPAALTNVAPTLSAPGTLAGTILWTPTNLETPPMATLDGATAVWSGSTFMTSPNTGTLSGFITPTAGTPVKGVPLNGFDTIDLSAGQALGIAGRDWPANNISIFAVAKLVQDGTIRGLASMGYYQPTVGWVFYTSMVATALEGHTVNANDSLIFGSGGNGTQTRNVATPPIDPSWRFLFNKVGTENIDRNNGSVLSQSYSITGAIPGMTGQRLNIGSGNSLTAVSEVFGGQIAYLAVLTDPSQTDIENLEGWAAWKYGLQNLLPVSHPYKLGPPVFTAGLMKVRPPVIKPPTLGAPVMTATGQVSSGAMLTWARVKDNAGTAATRPFQLWYAGQTTAYRGPPNGQSPYAYGLPLGYSWYLGGDEYMGDPIRIPALRMDNASAWWIAYPEAFPYAGAPGQGTVGGSAKPTVPHQIGMRGYRTWTHRKTGGWTVGAGTPSSLLVPNRFFADQRAANLGVEPITTVSDPVYGSAYYYNGPPVSGTPSAGSDARAVHGWLSNWSPFAEGSVDGCFMIFDARVTDNRANMLIATGIDWWDATGGGPNAGGNAGYSQSPWYRLSDQWQTFIGTSLDENILRADPPPPLVGIPEF